MRNKGHSGPCADALNAIRSYDSEEFEKDMKAVEGILKQTKVKHEGRNARGLPSAVRGRLRPANHTRACDHEFLKIRQACGRCSFRCRKCGHEYVSAPLDEGLLKVHLAMTPSERLGVADAAFALWGAAK
jgi:hypothetical protein